MNVSIVTLLKLFVLVVALAMAVMAGVALTRRRRAPESGLLVLVMCAAAMYCFGYAFELAQTSLDGALFWLHVEYIGIPWIPALWIVLTRRHFGLRTPIVPLMSLPVIIALAEWTNGTHGLYDTSMMLAQRGPFWVVVVHRGPVAWVNLAFIYGALLYGAVLCFFHLRSASGLVRLQIMFFASSCLPPLIGYMIYFFGWSPWGLDLAPATLCLSLIIGYITVFRLECFDLVPMARSLVFKSIRDSVLVADLQHRLVDFNPAARALLPALSEASLGCELSSVFPAESGLAEALLAPEGIHRLHLALPVEGRKQQFEVNYFPLGTERQQLGWAVILANITAQVELVRSLQRHAETDSLTEVANRRGFNTAIDRECARAIRCHSQFAVMLIDVDHFKTINDRKGHAMGDRVLRSIARRISVCLRATDLLSRYGGDEFAVLLPDLSFQEAKDVAERIRIEVEAVSAKIGTAAAPTTISIGLTVHTPGDGADPRKLLEQADKALYNAKSEGRNQVAVWQGMYTEAPK